MAKDIEQRRADAREWIQKYRKNHPEYKEKEADYRRKNSKYLAAVSKKWRQENRERKRAYNKKYREEHIGRKTVNEKKYKDRNWMELHYIEKRLSLESIAFEADCSKMTVYRYLLKFKIPVRDRIIAVKERFKK